VGYYVPVAVFLAAVFVSGQFSDPLFGVLSHGESANNLMDLEAVSLEFRAFEPSLRDGLFEESLKSRTRFNLFFPNDILYKGNSVHP
jgi:hypothetical protein